MNNVDPFYILCCDGGGVKGKIISVLLKEIEDNLQIFLSKKFDMFAGTSIGGVISVSMGCLHKSMTEINDNLSCDNFKKIMNKSIIDKIFDRFQVKPKYSGSGKSEIFRQIFTDKKFTDTDGKLVLITSFDIDNEQAYIFRSHKESKNLLAVDVVDATSAAPLYFPTINVKNCTIDKKETDLWLIDGGIIANNPTMCAISEAKRYLKQIGQEQRKIKVLSIGTGYKKKHISGKDTKDYGGIEWLIKGNILDITTNNSLVNYQAKWLLGENYLRIDGSLKDASEKLDNVSSENFNLLNQLGKDWWITNEKQIREFFELNK
jgi:patatin-like phospholipase/acyl hydrolase